MAWLHLYKLTIRIIGGQKPYFNPGSPDACPSPIKKAWLWALFTLWGGNFYHPQPVDLVIAIYRPKTQLYYFTQIFTYLPQLRQPITEKTDFVRVAKLAPIR
jgi:hypothetical protein